jgi:pimeloyl-ACP methyl ester carboxylesterase
VKPLRSYLSKLTLFCLTILFLTHAAPVFAESAETTVVLVHGAFSDGAAWDKVIPLLQVKGYKVVAVHLPLSSLEDDVAVTKRAIAEQTGPVVLVGHSWGGMVISEAGVDDKVKALVYVSAFMPDEGESASDLMKPFPPAPGLAHPIVDSAGFLTLSPQDIQQFFAPDVPKTESDLIAVTQAPIQGASLNEAASAAAWKSKPSWLIAAAKDQVINPALYPAEAGRTHARLITLNSSHVSLLSHPVEVARVIDQAVSETR